MKDPYGSVLVLIRDDPTVSGIVSQRVSSQAEAPPSVQLIENARTRRPFGAGSGRIGVQLAIYFARCFGPDSPTGAITAGQLAGAVSDALNGKAVTGSTYLLRTWAPDLDGMNRDPDTKWPFVDVRCEIYAATA